MEIASREQPGTDARLARLEGENRWLKRAAGGTAVVAALSLLLGAAALKTVEAERFLLRDARGKVRVAIGPDPGGLACVISDVNGKGKVRVGINDDGTFAFKVLGEAPPAAPPGPAKPGKVPPAKR